jgi:OHCU decarboxylase
MTLRELNQSTDAEDALLRCCGSTRWAQLMASARPFASMQALMAAADECWNALERRDWLEAFAAHPRIGERAADPWAAREQAGTAGAALTVLERLAQANRAYEARFGYIFIVCASGKTADQMSRIAEQRLTNDPHRELLVAAEEQRSISRLRLEKLMETA